MSACIYEELSICFQTPDDGDWYESIEAATLDEAIALAEQRYAESEPRPVNIVISTFDSGDLIWCNRFSAEGHGQWFWPLGEPYKGDEE